MPASGRMTHGAAAADPIGQGRGFTLLACAVLVVPGGPAFAATEGTPGGGTHWPEILLAAFSREETAALTLILGILAFAVTVSIMHVRTRDRLRRRVREADERIAELRARAEHAEGLLSADQQILVVWEPDGGGLDIRGDRGGSPDLPERTEEVLAFGKWLSPESAGELDELVARLRGRGESFNVMLKTRAGGYVEADGRIAAGRAALRLRDLAGQRRELAEIYHRHKQLKSEVDAMRGLLDGLPMPAWVRDEDHRLSWANAAYARVMGAPSGEAAVAEKADLLSAGSVTEVAGAGNGGEGETRRLSVALRGTRHVLDVYEAPARRGYSGIAVDVTELEAMRRELERRDSTHARTLDHVSEGIAVFAPDGRLTFRNSAFEEMWELDAAFLDAGPGYADILDRLRTQARLPEQADYREWRARQLQDGAGAGSADGEVAHSDLWHLPDGRILRVTRAVYPDGSAGCLFENVTRTLDLESRFVALTRVQRETLESLDEGIAVFGSDGRLKLHNPAFLTLWRLDPPAANVEPHIEEVIGWCRELYDDETVWRSLKMAVTGLAESREAAAARLERPDGTILELRALPLPDGATLTVFTDISDSAKIEKALRDRNEALMAAARIKNEFVHKVSYELRAPLTNIIGFAQLMSEEATGPLNERQREYTGYILNSSGALLAIINDILDLATVDAGVMELDVSEVDIAGAVKAAANAIGDRVAEHGVLLEIDVPEGIGGFEADEKRVRQILFNLLSNAVGFSQEGQTVSLGCRREGHEIVFSVSDRGPGIPESVRRGVFDRFESHALGTHHRGVGLGLSIVKSFVELHGGKVTLDSEPGRGTTVTCVFPERPVPGAAAGESGDAEMVVTPLTRPRDTESGRPARLAGRSEAT